MKTLKLKKYLFGFGIILLFSGCTITRTTYEGSMTFPQNIMFDNANFKYVKTINGSSYAVYNGFGNDKQRVSEGLINSAKAEMYKTHTFMPNQVITNISRDIIRTYDEKGIISKYEVKVVMSADVYEFSNNGVYSSKDNSNNHITTKQSIKNSRLTNEDTKGYTEGDFNLYDIDDEIIFVLGEKFYKGTVAEKSTAQDLRVSFSKSAERINGIWVSIEPSKVRQITKTFITHYKLSE